MPLLYISLFSFIFLFLILFFYYSKISAFFDIYDKPDLTRKIHKVKIPLFGGIIIFFYLFLFIFLNLLFLDINLFINFFYFSETKNFIIFLFTLFLVFILGFIDDKLKIRNSNRVIILFFILIPLLLNDNKLLFYNINFSILEFNLKLTLNNLSLYFTIIFIIALIISLNIFDGINLQSGFFYIINFAILSYLIKSPIIVLLIIFPVIIFLYFNYKNKCFLGESGCNVLSFLLIFFLLVAHNKILINFDYILLFIYLPLIDAFRLFFTRIMKNKSPFYPDKNHIHHILIDNFKFKKAIFIITILLINPHIFYILNLNMSYILIINIFCYFFIIIFCNTAKRRIYKH